MATKRPFGTIRKLPSGRYQVRYRRLGRQVSSGLTFSTKADAHTHLSALETDLQRGTFIDPDVGRITFDDFANAWLANRDLRPRTRETYESQLKHLTVLFGRSHINAITTPDVRAWHGDLLRSDLHRNTVSKCYRMFRTIMTTAVDDGLLLSNPVQLRGAAKERSVERPLLTWSDVTSIADTIHPRFSAFIWLAASSGLRFGELAGLTVDNVDADLATVRVTQSLSSERGRGPVLGEPKTTSSYRTVAVPPAVIAKVMAHLNDTHIGATNRHAPVFTSIRGKPLLNQYFAPYWRRTVESLGMETVRFHDLRHLAGTEAASAGASLREVMARMGHASSDASLRYLKASELRDRDIADALAERIANAAL